MDFSGSYHAYVILTFFLPTLLKQKCIIFSRHASLFEGIGEDYNIPLVATAKTVRDFDEGLTRGKVMLSNSIIATNAYAEFTEVAPQKIPCLASPSKQSRPFCSVARLQRRASKSALSEN